MNLEIVNRADGVDGHYCIRHVVDGWCEYYNDGKWLATCEVFYSFKSVVDKANEINNGDENQVTTISKFDVINDD
jgi:hypothetical protein